MPSCRRCGKSLAAADVRTSNWTGISKKDFYSCPRCGGMWLYSSSLNCPVLIDPRNILGEDQKGIQASEGRRRTGAGRRRSAGGPKSTIRT